MSIYMLPSFTIFFLHFLKGKQAILILTTKVYFYLFYFSCFATEC